VFITGSLPSPVAHRSPDSVRPIHQFLASPPSSAHPLPTGPVEPPVAEQATTLRPPPIEPASSPSGSPTSSPSLARPRCCTPPPPLCPGVAQPHTILPVVASWSTRWPRLLRSPSTRVKHSRKPSGGGLGPPPRAPQRRLPRRRRKRQQGRPLSARFSS
jgi:hypothetical protein